MLAWGVGSLVTHHYSCHLSTDNDLEIRDFQFDIQPDSERLFLGARGSLISRNVSGQRMR